MKEQLVSTVHCIFCFCCLYSLLLRLVNETEIGVLPIVERFKTRQDKTFIIIILQEVSTISWHAVSKKTLVEACQINSITNQILQIISKKLSKEREKKNNV